jgi:hypothetical protein
LQVLASLADVALLRYAGYRLLPLNAATQGFAYLLLILIIANRWGFSALGLTEPPQVLHFGPVTHFQPMPWRDGRRGGSVPPRTSGLYRPARFYSFK